MAGVKTPGDEGREVQRQQVPAIGGADYRAKEGLPTSVPVMASVHLGDGTRAEGVAYDTNASIGEKLDTGAYPTGSVMADKTPGESVN